MKSKSIIKSIKRGDIWLTACLLAVGILTAVAVTLFRPTGQLVSLEQNGKTVALYRLDTDTRVTVTALDGSGENTLVIKDGVAFIESASCRDLICVGHSPISKDGETIVCLPHRLVVRIISAEDEVTQ